MRVFKKVISVVGLIGAYAGVLMIWDATLEYYWNHVLTKTFGVCKI